FFDRDLFEPFPIAELRGQEDRSAQAATFPHIERREAGGIPGIRHREEFSAGEEAGFGFDPAHFFFSADSFEQPAQMAVAHQRHMVEALPMGIAELPGAREAAKLRSRFAEGDALALLRKAVSERHAQHAAAYNCPVLLSFGAHSFHHNW